MLLARLATDKVKPNGQMFISEEESHILLENLSVSKLPFIGRVLSRRLKNELNVNTCNDLLKIPMVLLYNKLY